MAYRGWECVGITGSVLFADCSTVIVAKVANIAYMYIHVVICLHLKFECLLVHCMCIYMYNVHVYTQCMSSCLSIVDLCENVFNAVLLFLLNYVCF